MRRLLSASAVISSLSLAFAGCATVAPQRHQGPMGSIVGVVSLPQGASADAVCPGLSVAAVTDQGVALGDASVHVSHNRCLYTIDYVKAGVPVKLEVQASAARVCASGAVAPDPQPKTFELQDTETRTVDTALHCA
jgi:hypothetical protein